MDLFHTLTLRDKKTFNEYCDKCKFLSYEYTFASLYLWRNLSNTKFLILDNTLIVKKTEDNFGTFFMIPYNYTADNLNKILKFLLDYQQSTLHYDFNNCPSLCKPGELYLFGDVENFFIDDLKKYSVQNFEIVDTPEDYEYIYLTNDLINLIGQKYHSKKNLFNYFIKNYNYTICEINSPKIINDCIELLSNWEKNKTIIGSELKIEKKVIRDLLNNFIELDLKSIAIYVDDVLAGFSIGEKAGDTAIIHIERCDISYKGIYSFINKTFLELYFKDTVYVNRQEDCGDSGLRKSKQSYHPINLLKKSFLKITYQ